MSGAKAPADLLREGWVHGVDVSDHQDPARIDWGQVRESGVASGGTGIQFAWVKLTEGQTFVAKHGRTHALGAHLAGIRVGGYHYARPDTDAGPNDAILEARHFVGGLYSAGESVANGLPPVLDYEESADGLDRDWIESFCSEVERLAGVVPWVYTSRDTYQKYIPARYRRWIAAYSPAEKSSNLAQWACWQYTSSGLVSGFRGPLDLNLMSPEAWASLQS